MKISPRSAMLPAGLVLVALSCGRAPRQTRETLAIAAAADLDFAMKDIAAEFERGRPGLRIRPTYGSSGNFYSQIRNGAPFDVYLSADVEYPRKLAAQGIGVEDSVFLYAVGRIVVWVPAASKLDPAAALRDPAVRHLAIANPTHAPYGRAAEAALRSMGLYDRVSGKLVLGENISQTFGFVQSGAADAGIVALSLAMAPTARGKGRYWEIPPEDYPRIEQGGLLLRPSPGAREFIAFLTSGPGRAILKRYGFALPEKS